MTSPEPTAGGEFDFAASASGPGVWSYPLKPGTGELWVRDDGRPIGSFKYPNCVTDYFMDTGVRGRDAAEGALLTALGSGEMLTVNSAIQRSLQRVRPYGGTPIAASLDDLYHFFTTDPESAPAMARDTAAHHVVLISEGYPDADYRDFGCNCANEGDPADTTRCGGTPPCTDPVTCSNHPSEMHCPYPTPEDAAAALRAVDVAVQVIGFDVDPSIAGRLNAIARSGSGQDARFADDGAELRATLGELIEEIAAPR